MPRLPGLTYEAPVMQANPQVQSLYNISVSLFRVKVCRSKTSHAIPVRVGFHKGHSRGVKSAYDLGKMNSSICKRSHKFDGIGDGRTRTFPFSAGSNYDSFA